MKFKLGWTGDNHIGFQQYGMVRRKRDFEIAFESMVDSMIGHGVSAIINTGDLIHSNRPGPDDIKFLQKVNKKLLESKIPMFIISGNHDRTTPHWIEAVQEQGSGGMQLIDFRLVRALPDFPGFTIYGVPYMSPEDFRKHDFHAAQILVMHQAVKEFIDFDAPNILAIDDLPKGYELIAIGDIHVTNVIPNPHGGLIGYPGSTEMNAKEEREEKFWLLVDCEDSSVIGVTPVQIQTRPVIRLELDSVEDIEPAIEQIRGVKKASEALGDSRAPMVFIRYLNTIDGLINRFRVAFDSSDYVLRFKPVFVAVGKTIKQDKVKDNVTVEDLVKGVVADRQDLVAIITQLANPELDPHASIDAYIASRLPEKSAIAA